MRELEVSDCEMQEGSLRCDANINLHISEADGTTAATPIIEVKNLNSFRGVERAMKFEAERQFQEFQRNLGTQWEVDRDHPKKFGSEPVFPVRETVSKKEIAKATAGWDDKRGVTEIQRRKEVLQALNERKVSIKEFAISAAALGNLIQEIKATGLNKQRAREVFAEMLAGGASAREAIDKLGFKVIADESQLAEIVRRAIAANPKAVADFKKGKTKAADAIKGAVMRETKGMAKTELVQRLLLDELAKSS